MTKTFKFKTGNTNNNSLFLTKNKNYSEILDDIIAADVTKKNDYLFNFNTVDITDYIDNSPIIINGSKLKDNTKFINATKFLAGYKTYKKSYALPFILGKMYELNNGTRIVFYDDEIQIDADVYKYEDFSNLNFLNTLSAKKKDIIINIYTAGIGNIKINLL